MNEPEAVYVSEKNRLESFGGAVNIIRVPDDPNGDRYVGFPKKSVSLQYIGPTWNAIYVSMNADLAYKINLEPLLDFFDTKFTAFQHSSQGYVEIEIDNDFKFRFYGRFQQTTQLGPFGSRTTDYYTPTTLSGVELIRGHDSVWLSIRFDLGFSTSLDLSNTFNSYKLMSIEEALGLYENEGKQVMFSELPYTNAFPGSPVLAHRDFPKASWLSDSITDKIYSTWDGGRHLHFNTIQLGTTKDNYVNLNSQQSWSATVSETSYFFPQPIYGQPGYGADLITFDSLSDAHKQPGSAERAVFLSNDLDLSYVGSEFVPDDNRYGTTSDGLHSKGFAAVYGFFGQYTSAISFDISGKNKFTDVITDAVTGGSSADGTLDLYLTNGSNGDAFFLHDAFSDYHKDVVTTKDVFGNNYAARIENINSIFAGDGDDIIDLTTTESIGELSGGGASHVYAGNGDDVILVQPVLFSVKTATIR